MGSVKDLILPRSELAKLLPLAAELYRPPRLDGFGRGVWFTKGTWSVKDVKELIPSEAIVRYKPEELAMLTSYFFEWFQNKYPEIKTCYLGMMDHDGNVTTAHDLIDKGELSNLVVMELACTPNRPEFNGDLKKYRRALQSGELQCGVADVESIFRGGLPLGASTFKRIARYAGFEDEYKQVATYEDTVALLDKIRDKVLREGLSEFPKLEEELRKAGVEGVIPNPGLVLRQPVFDSTTKFEGAGDREIGKDEERALSGLDDEGYHQWTQEIFPTFSKAQIEFGKQRNLLIIDGKGECVAYKRRPVITDYACTPDENREMIIVDRGGEQWAIPSNKEIARAKFTEAGIDLAISDAKERAENEGDIDKWRTHMEQSLYEHKIDIRAVSDNCARLMGNAIAEVANRTFGKTVFDVPPLETWVDEFMPYASKIEYQR